MGHIKLDIKTFKSTHINIANVEKEEQETKRKKKHIKKHKTDGNTKAEIHFPTGTDLIFIDINYLCDGKIVKDTAQIIFKD